MLKMTWTLYANDPQSKKKKTLGICLQELLVDISISGEKSTK